MLEMHYLQPVKTFAIEQHANSGRTYGGKPYEVHLQWVENVLRRFGHTDGDPLLTAAWLHDVMEDCGVSFEVLEAGFGLRVANLVWAVTDAPWGRDRNEKKYWAYLKTRACPGATRLKLADRIANVEACREDNHPNFERMYVAEHPRFKACLYRQGEDEDMWALLDSYLEKP